MNRKDITGLIPDQYTGEEIYTEAKATLHSEAAAIVFYNTVKRRLQDVNEWHRTAGFISGKFQVTDVLGNPINKPAEQGNFIRIDIPGPGSKAGEGYDWVMVEAMNEVSESKLEGFGFRVRPVANPHSDNESIAHFYDDSATSSFIVTRDHDQVIASIIDRNVKPNDDTSSLADRIRHTAVGVSAIGMFSKMQWQKLTDGLVAMDGE